MATDRPQLSATPRPETLDLDDLLDEVQAEMERGLENAVEKAGEAIELARRRGSAGHEGNALHLRGWARFGTGEMLGAIQDQLAAVEVLKGCGDEQGVGRSLHALGAIYATIGEPTVAVEHFEQATEIQIRIGDKWGEARTRNGFAVTMAQGEQYEDAAAAFLEVAETFEEVGDRWWVLMARVNRGVTLMEQIQAGELPDDQARTLGTEILGECDAAIAEADSLGQSGVSVELYARHCRAGVLHLLGDPAGSLAELEIAFPMATRAGDATILIDLEMHSARALEALGRTGPVFGHLDRAEEMARTAGRDRHLGQSLELRARICEERGDLAGALEAHRKFHQQKTRARQQAEEMRAKVIRSLLETQRAEHDLQLARAEVEKLEALGHERRRMVSVIAHELRNPITTVLGLSEEMHRNWVNLGDEGRQLMGLIRDEAGDLANIVEDLLAIDSIEQGSLQVDIERCELRPMVDSIIGTIPLDGKNASVSGSAEALADPVRFRQVLRNLVSNAVRYGGDEIAIELLRTGASIAIEVRDNGRGVPEDDSASIFEPYQRSSGGDHGSRSVGLGLAVTRQLARLMHGDVRYERRGDETVFSMVLPAPQPA